MIIDGEYTVLSYSDKYVPIKGNFGGGSQPTPHTPIEANDTLSSKQTLAMLFAVWDGEGQSIDQVYVNGTPSTSFDCTVYKRLGTLDQTIIPGFLDIETPFSVSTVLAYNTAIARSVSSSLVDAVRVTLKLNALFQVLENGDKVGYQVSFTVQTRPEAGTGTWTTVGIITKSGKASSVYGWDTRINKPPSATGAWEFRITRTTATDTSKKSSVCSFDSYTEIQDKKLTYPGTGLVGIIFHNADQLGGRIPTISFDGKGLKLKVPTSAFYNAALRTYTGTPWNGAFVTAYQYNNSPPWFLYNILTEALDFVYATKTYRRGLGISESFINKFSFFEGAQYCDAKLSDGKGGQIARFSINNQFYTRENAPTFLAYCLTIMNANLVIQNGLITLVIDKPLPVTKLVSNSNVIDGEFSYSGTHIDERYTWVNVTFNDPDDKNNTKTISEGPSAALISHLGFDPTERYGFNPIDIVLVGCTSEAQARRKARWILEMPAGIVTFKRGFDGAFYNVGEVVNVYDTRYTNIDGQGTIAASTTTSLTLDHEIEFGAGPYTIMVYGSDGVTILEKLINQANTTTNVVTPATAFATVPIKNGPFIIKGEIIPRPFKISKITKGDEEGTVQYTVLAIAYDATKWDRIEGTVTVTPGTGVFTNVDEFETEPVENIRFHEIFSNNGVNSSAKLEIEWDWDVNNSEKFLPTYDVLWRRDNLAFQRLPGRQVKEAEILNAVPGVYEVIIYAVNIRGIKSIGITQVYNYRVSPTTSTLVPPENFWVKDTVDVIYNSTHLDVTWSYPSANESVRDVLKDYVLEVWTSDGVTKKNTYIVPYVLTTKGGFFNYTLQMNIADFGTPTRSVQLKVYSRDITGDISVPLAKTFNNPVPDTPSFTLNSGVGVTYFDLISLVPLDFAGVKLHRSTTSGFTPDNTNLVYEGPDTYGAFAANQGLQYYYRAAVYDSFSREGLNYSSQIATTTLTLDPTNWAKSGVNFTANSPSANYLSWTAGTILKNADVNYTIVAGNALWTTGRLYIYFDPAISTTTLQSTTALAVAIGTGRWPIATYEGGTNLKGGDGSAFFSGSQLIAASVGATQMVVDQAVITNGIQIANAIVKNQHVVNDTIDFGKITNTLQSSNWSTTLFRGWRLDKTGTFTSYGSVRLYNTSNQLMFDGNGLDGTYIKQATIKKASIGIGEIDTLRVAGQAFSFKLAVTKLAVSSGAWNTWVNIGSFTTAIEYQAEIEGLAACYVRASGLNLGGSTEGFLVDIRIRRTDTNAVVGISRIGKVWILGTNFISILNPIVQSPGAIQTQIAQFPGIVPMQQIQGNGDLIARPYAVEMSLTWAGTTSISGTITLSCGNSVLRIGVLKR